MNEPLESINYASPRVKTYPRRRIGRIIGIVAAAIVVGLIIATFVIEPRAEKELRLASAHLPKVTAALQNDARFNQIFVASFIPRDGTHGYVLLSGYVRTSDFSALQQCVSSTSPPVRVKYMVRSLTTKEYDEVEKLPH